MKLQYWGTAAAEGIPALFCHCDVCNTARARGGRHIRTRSQAVLDDSILIDFPADTYCHTLRHGADAAKFEHLLITHTHSDHFYPADFEMRINGFAHIGNAPQLNVYGSKGATDYGIDATKKRGLQLEGTVQFVALEPYKRYDIGGYDVIAFPASHGANSFPFIYWIGKDGKGLFYCHDTGPLFEETWDFLAKEKLPMSFVSCDCTEAASPTIGYDAHMNLNRNLDLRERLTAIGCADEKTLFCCNHFSHNGGNVSYDEFSKIAAEKGFLTAYDGMTVEF